MYAKIAAIGATAAVILGAGTAAFALSTDSTSGTPTTAHAASSAKAHPRLDRLAQRTIHGQFVTAGKGGTFVTHDVIRGTVDAVSAKSIKVTATDRTSETYAVTAATKVRIRTNGKGAKGTISQVHAGDQVVLLGTGTTSLTATTLVDAGKR